jgi:hypothetical protein
MADLSLSPAPSAAEPVSALAPAASRPVVAPPKAETADPDEDKKETDTPTRAAPAAAKATVVGAASTSESLGGLMPDFFSDGTDEASPAISTGRAIQPQSTLARAGAVPTDTGLPLIEGNTDAADNCSSSDLSCRWSGSDSGR